MSGWRARPNTSLYLVLVVSAATLLATGAAASHTVTEDVIEAVRDEAEAMGLSPERGDTSQDDEPAEAHSDETQDEAPSEDDAAPSDGDSETDERRARLAALLADSRAQADEAVEQSGASELVLLVDGTLTDVRDTATDMDVDLGGLVPALEDGAEEEDPQTSSEATVQEPMVPTAVLIAGAATAAAASIAIFWIAGSSGVAGAGGSAAAKGTVEGARRVAPVFSPLFTRFERATVMAHPNREQLYTLISTNPGVRLQDLCDHTGLSRTAVTHHLRLLEQQHLVVSKRIGRSRHFYENGGRFEREQKDAYAILQNDRSKDIARFIHENPGTIQKHLCEGLGLRASIAHWHIKRLEEAHLVEAVRRGRTVSYYPADAMGRVAL